VTRLSSLSLLWTSEPAKLMRRSPGPAECIGAIKQRIEGDPDPMYVSTSYVERSNLTHRMHNRRFRRLTNGFPKKFENHAYSVALFAMYYNFVKVHSTLRVSPAMAAGVSKTLWEVGDIVKLVEAGEARPTKRGPYKKRAAGRGRAPRRRPAPCPPSLLAASEPLQDHPVSPSVRRVVSGSYTLTMRAALSHQQEMTGVKMQR